MASLNNLGSVVNRSVPKKASEVEETEPVEEKKK
jgi:hypothetical protein